MKCNTSVGILPFYFFTFAGEMGATRLMIVFSAIVAIAMAQRPFYAGSRPIGYPNLPAPELSNRFGDDSPLPVQAYGDRNFVYRIQQLPIDKQPFWYINSKFYDMLRKNPQNWPHRPSAFID